MTAHTVAIERIRYLSEAACLAETPRPFSAVVSITEPDRDSPLPSGWGAVLHVQFLDAEFDEALLRRLHSRGTPPKLDAIGMPCRERCAPILTFLDALEARPEITELLVHCHAGQRRSAAVAKFAAERFSVPFDHDYAGFNTTVYALLQAPDRFDGAQQLPGSRGFLSGLAARFRRLGR